MSRIDELIAELAPGGVKYWSLDDISKTVSGLTAKSKADFSGGNARYVSYKNAFANSSTDQSANDFVRISDGERQNKLREGDVIITGSSESLDEVGMSSVVETEPVEPLYLNSFCFAVRFTGTSLMLPGFSKHLFRSEGVRAQIRRCANGVTRINISKVRFGKIRIPVPPLEIQREIVRILDQFTQLEAELEAELEARRAQYDHYRTRAFDFPADVDVRWSTLGEISTRVSSGATPKAGAPEYYESGTIPWLRTSEVTFGEIWNTEMKITDRALTETGTSWIRENCVIIAISGATAARSAINKIPLTTNQHCCNLQVDEAQADYRYVFFWISSKYEELKSLGRGARSDLNAALIKGFPIPVPSIDVQRRVVFLLDKFDALVNDLSIGLPAELSARRKQYEYYRDKLLTFPEAS